MDFTLAVKIQVNSLKNARDLTAFYVDTAYVAVNGCIVTFRECDANGVRFAYVYHLNKRSKYEGGKCGVKVWGGSEPGVRELSRNVINCLLFRGASDAKTVSSFQRVKATS